MGFFEDSMRRMREVIGKPALPEEANSVQEDLPDEDRLSSDANDPVESRSRSNSEKRPLQGDLIDEQAATPLVPERVSSARERVRAGDRRILEYFKSEAPALVFSLRAFEEAKAEGREKIQRDLEHAYEEFVSVMPINLARELPTFDRLSEDPEQLAEGVAVLDSRLADAVRAHTSSATRVEDGFFSKGEEGTEGASMDTRLQDLVLGRLQSFIMAAEILSMYKK